MSEQPDEALHSLLDTFAPGISWLIRLISAALGVNLLSSILPLVALPIISTFLLPSLSRALEPIISLFVTSADIKHRNNLYPQVMRWVSSVRFHSCSSSVIVGITEAFGYLWDSNDDSLEYVETEIPAYRGKIEKVRVTPGQERFHFFRYQKCWFAFYRDPHRNAQDPFSRNAENITIYYMSWNRAAFENLLEDIQKFNVDCRRGRLAVFCARQDKRDAGWQRMCDEIPRSLESLAQDKQMKLEMIADVERFLSKDVIDYYQKRGIPYRRGYLFHGPPGTGKSSCCKVIATHFELSTYIINLATVDDYGLQELFRTLPAPPARCMVVLEDIDTTGINRRGNTVNEDKDASPPKGIKLATVLNALDGIGAHNGHILVATTNAKTALDPALTRPGRIDKQFEFRNLDAQTTHDYFSFFFQDADVKSSNSSLDQLASRFSDVVSHLALSPATLQEYFLQCNQDPVMAVKNAAELESTDL
jgi:chaperone BCS1